MTTIVDHFDEPSDESWGTDGPIPKHRPASLDRCPFVKAVAAGELDKAAELAARPPEPAEPVVVDWLIGEARRQLAAAWPKLDTPAPEGWAGGELHLPEATRG